MKLYFTIAIIFILSSPVLSQTYSLRGYILDEDANPVPFSTAVLLNPEDSTLAFYSVADSRGYFEIKHIKSGNYLLQIAYLGYETIYQKIDFPGGEKKNNEAYIMKKKTYDMEEVSVTGERIPIQIKSDTVIYDAAAFKTKPGAVVEDLLKKLPGIEVDRAGNIKAMGEDVKNVLVDGKEFFGNDTKIASKNLPAEAVDKIHLFDKKSEEAEFTGIDDGTREKTVDIKLKKDKKDSFFGDITAGYGTGNHYKGSAKAYRFDEKMQLAGLGMVNNINQYGFSFNDYINFNGGMTNMMNGSGSAKIELSSDSSFPVNFGQPITGLLTSGAGGINFSYSKNADKRFFTSYILNTSDKDLQQHTDGRYFTPETSFTQTDILSETNNNHAHRANIGYRNKITPFQKIVLNGSVSFLKTNSTGENHRNSFENDLLIYRQKYVSGNNSAGFTGNINGVYLKKSKNEKTIFKLQTDVSFAKNTGNIRYDNFITQYGTENYNNLFQNNKTDKLTYFSSISMTRKLNHSFYVVSSVAAGNISENLSRVQGSLSNGNPVDDANTKFNKQYRYFRPEISLKHGVKKSKINLSIGAEAGKMALSPENKNTKNHQNIYFTPAFSYEYEYKKGRRISLDYRSRIETPTADQLLPVANDLNPLSVFYGNPQLKPEHHHDLRLTWWIFDQFSFTSFTSSVNMDYTKNKINWTSQIDENLAQSHTLVNVAKDYLLNANVSFSTPIKKLGVKININIEESYSGGINFVNSIQNTVINKRTRFSTGIENRKKDKVDILSGIGATLQNTKYSVQNSLDRRYFDVFWYGQINYSPDENWNFDVSADITRYTSHTFDSSVQIPMLNASISYGFLKNNRAMLFLSVSDMLNRNTGIQRFGELNYLREVRSNVPGRYFMISFKYKLSKFGGGEGIDVKIGGRR